jgi:N-acetylmuramoyl-L-alanine amidase
MKWCLMTCLFLISVMSRAQDMGKTLLGRTTGKIPFLEYGLGDDRLGGAKMTYLDTNILLQVVDSSGSDYRVRLSGQHHAYIAKESLRLLPGEKPRPYYLSGSWRAFGDSAYDYVTVQLEEKLPYRSIQQINPSRLVVEIFGATSNTNWITQLGTLKEIRNTWYEQSEDDVMRLFIELRHPQHWGHALYYDSTGNKLIVRVNRQPDLKKGLKGLRIAVDAGHGGDNSGASGVTSNRYEKELTLLIAQELEKALKKAGVKQVYMTRRADTSLGMSERILALREWRPDLLVSVHLNSAGSDTVSGTSTYYRYIGFRPLSQAILARMLELKLKEYGNIGSFNFALSGPIEYPNCLVEVAFLSNPNDEKRILDPKFRKAVAAKITAGVQDWVKGMK